MTFPNLNSDQVHTIYCDEAIRLIGVTSPWKFLCSVEYDHDDHASKQ